MVDLACGFDARAFRLTFPPDTAFFEVDRAEVLSLKATRLARIDPQPPLTCAHRASVPADIVLDDWEARLQAEGFDSSLPTVWVIEGLLTYLDEATAVSVLRRIKAISAFGSRLAFDCVNVPMRFLVRVQECVVWCVRRMPGVIECENVVVCARHWV